MVGQMRFSLLQLHDVMACVCVCVSELHCSRTGKGEVHLITVHNMTPMTEATSGFTCSP